MAGYQKDTCQNNIHEDVGKISSRQLKASGWVKITLADYSPHMCLIKKINNEYIIV